MSKPIQFIYLLSVLILAIATESNVLDLHHDVRKQILENYLVKGNMKSLFKVYHFTFGKTYDYNTPEGINKYKTFRSNVIKMIEHNKSNSEWKMGINHLTDMTFDEVKAYYNIKNINPKEVTRQLRSISLDDFNDDDDQRLNNNNIKEAENNVSYATVDWRSKGILRPVKDQLNCGSCWAFSVISMVEGVWSKKKGILTYDLSVQDLVDCDTADNGCNGGQINNAINYLKIKGAIKETDYPYKGIKGVCNTNFTPTPVKTTGYLYTYCPDKNYNNLSLNGPLAGFIEVNDSFRSYATGVWSAPCSALNHGIVIVGYNLTDDAWIVQNSWGSTWGEKGFIRVKNQGTSNNYSCFIGRYGYQATFA